MRVAVDGLPFENDGQLGIWRYAYEVLGRLAGRADVAVWLGSRAARPIPPGIRVIRDASREPARRWNFLTRARRLAARRRPPRDLSKADVYQATYFTPCPTAGPARVVTVYDMIAERLFPICPGWAESDIGRKRAAIRSATRCVCISQATADDLLTFYPEVADRVRVVHLGADHLIGPPAGDYRREPVALFVGHRNQYKNFWLLATAMARPAWPPGVTVHVVGSPPDPPDTALMHALGVADRVRFLGRLSDDDLKRQYRSAACFVFPSLLEGFGLPILEAQANSCPVVCSDIPVFREVAGPAAVYFDPRLDERLADAVASACEPEASRRLVEAGYENVRRFSWERAADQTFAVYQEAAARGGNL